MATLPAFNWCHGVLLEHDPRMGETAVRGLMASYGAIESIARFEHPGRGTLVALVRFSQPSEAYRAVVSLRVIIDSCEAVTSNPTPPAAKLLKDVALVNDEAETPLLDKSYLAPLRSLSSAMSASTGRLNVQGETGGATEAVAPDGLSAVVVYLAKAAATLSCDAIIQWACQQRGTVIESFSDNVGGGRVFLQCATCDAAQVIRGELEVQFCGGNKGVVHLCEASDVALARRKQASRTA